MSIQGFPFPFRADTFRYGTNVERARTPVRTEAGEWGARILDVDENYRSDLAERARILQADPGRSCVLPHAVPACWDALLTMLRELASTYSDEMRLDTVGRGYRWRNARLDADCTFAVGDDLPGGPLGFLASQIQDDVVVLDQREGALWADAGVVTFAAGWSLGFDVGMAFSEIHGPVPRIRADGVVSRAERFLMRLRPNEEYRRTNWSATLDGHLDQSTEAYETWGPARAASAGFTGDELAGRLYLRVEVQHLIRLGYSGAILFLIRTYLCSLEELATVPEWRTRFGRVLRELPEDMASYKGLSPFRATAADWLLSPGRPGAAESPAPAG
ncbi:heme-dependent oxidative N-demethylase family protein [Cryptosporangium sp. NPDC051539]|uniref:heme-dependent oxidative N-demethylase family protein n=1 Tax=Cryptosporangium sp. NPDC051539 TaxID=3363962 RepID=UPI0037B007D4